MTKEKQTVTKWKVWAGMTAIFLAGNCIGVVGAGLAVRQIVMATLTEGPPAISRLVIKRLSSRLDLSPAQETTIGATVADTQQRLLILRGRHQPEIRAIVEDGMQQIRKELTPAQQEKLDRFYQQMRHRFTAYKIF